MISWRFFVVFGSPWWWLRWTETFTITQYVIMKHTNCSESVSLHLTYAIVQRTRMEYVKIHNFFVEEALFSGIRMDKPGMRWELPQHSVLGTEGAVTGLWTVLALNVIASRVESAGKKQLFLWVLLFESGLFICRSIRIFEALSLYLSWQPIATDGVIPVCENSVTDVCY